MLGRGGLITVLIFSLALAGCEVASFYTKEKLERGNKTAHVLLMAPDVQLGEVTAGGLVEPNAAWTAIAEKHVVAALKEQLAKRKSRIVLYRSPKADTPKARIHTQLIKLHNAVGRSILLHKFAAPHGSSVTNLAPITRCSSISMTLTPALAASPSSSSPPSSAP